MPAGKALVRIASVAGGVAVEHTFASPGTYPVTLTVTDGAGPHGAMTADGRIAGAYVHGLFQAGSFRKAFLEDFGARSSGVDHAEIVDAALDEIAGVLESALNVDALAQIANLKG